MHYKVFIAMRKNKKYLTNVKVLIRCDIEGCGSTAMQSVNTENREHYCLSKSDDSHWVDNLVLALLI